MSLFINYGSKQVPLEGGIHIAWWTPTFGWAWFTVNAVIAGGIYRQIPWKVNWTNTRFTKHRPDEHLLSLIGIMAFFADWWNYKIPDFALSAQCTICNRKFFPKFPADHPSCASILHYTSLPSSRTILGIGNCNCHRLLKAMGWASGITKRDFWYSILTTVLLMVFHHNSSDPRFTNSYGLQSWVLTRLEARRLRSSGYQATISQLQVSFTLLSRGLKETKWFRHD